MLIPSRSKARSIAGPPQRSAKSTCIGPAKNFDRPGRLVIRRLGVCGDEKASGSGASNGGSFFWGDTTLGSNHSVDVLSVSCVEVEKSHLHSSFKCGRCITRYYPLHMEAVV